MADLIDRAPMLEFLDLQHYDKDMLVRQYNPDWIYSWLESQTAVEAKPVVHGEWIHDINNLYGCSVCGGRETQRRSRLKPFCPNCGADMRERREA